MSRAQELWFGRSKRVRGNSVAELKALAVMELKVSREKIHA